MRAAIIVFSPTGNTLKVAEMLEKALMNRNILVQIVDITGKGDLFEGNLFDKQRHENFLRENVQPHDLICIGGPVRSYHLQYHVINLIKSLPRPNNAWGKLAVPFVTYGGISSGKALRQAAKLLNDSGRIIAAGMKINSFGGYTNNQIVKFKQGIPGDEALPFIEDLAERISISILKNKHLQNIEDVSKHLSYQSPGDKIRAYLMSEKLINLMFPDAKIDYKKCKGENCGVCVKICPVQIFKIHSSYPVKKKNAPSCIHCAKCSDNCPHEAIPDDFDDSPLVKTVKEEGLIGFLMASKERPKSAVYPLCAPVL